MPKLICGFAARFFFFLQFLFALHDTAFTILNTTNITYNSHNTNHNNYIYIVNNTYYTYNTKITYNVHTTYRTDAMPALSIISLK